MMGFEPGKAFYRYGDTDNRRPLEIVGLFSDQLKIYDPCSNITCLAGIMITTKLEPYIVFNDRVYWLNCFVPVQEGQDEKDT